MKIAVAFAFILSGCSSLPFTQAPQVSEPACSAACNAHFEQCPKVFANFPERGAVECPAEHDSCIKSCAGAAKPPPLLATAPPQPAAATFSASATAAKEAKLRELKHFYEEGLISEEVYRARQTAILAEP